MLKVTDDLGRELVIARPPRRVVSLVPSDTHSVVALGALDRLVGRTTYCESPEAAAVATVGGTKDIDVDAVVALAPDLVIANQEENTRGALEALALRVPVLVSLPRRVDQGIAHLARVARILGLAEREPARSLVRRGYALRGAAAVGLRAFVPIWMDPLMTFNADTFGSDVLAHVGVGNAFGDRLRLYPLAADLGKTAPRDAAGRDLRYPRITLDEVRARAPDLIVLPDEPHAFSADDEAALQGALPGVRVVRVSGKDLFWYGAWTIDALDRLAAQLAA
ncbi:MAG: ABC transporter substrate-binding protein [Deltaproteobacteria bacterium]|nr:MAG: ABC transporter substrate-binding protein [Deltaproteobacteria bacterium]TMQ17673.1 MAG: ABC transporter substrate-binding protein [Deltaproteobacteria bacterium]